MDRTPRHQDALLGVAMLCLPLAFQFAATAPVPGGLWPMFALSIWAGLVALVITCGLLVIAGSMFLRRRRRFPRC